MSAELPGAHASTQKRAWLAYALALVLCAATLLLRYGLGFIVGDLPMLVLYMIPIIISAYAGGLGAGLFCTALAALITNYFLIPPLYTFYIDNPKNLIQWSALIAAGVLVSVLTEGLHRVRRRAQEGETALRKTRNVLSNILESMPSAIVGIDNDGLVTHWNRGAEHLSGHSAQESLGRNLSQIFPWLAPKLEGIGRSLGNREAVFLEKQPLTQDGESHFVDVLAYPLVCNGCDGVVLRMDDVTRRVHMEEIMMQTEKMMSIGSLAGGMAHELNNPLSGILQSAQTIRMRFGPELEPNLSAARTAGCSMEAIQRYLVLRQIPEFLDAIKDSGERAARIVKNMLGFIRKSTSQHIPASLPDIMDRAVEIASTDYDLKKKYDFKHIEIIREYQPDMPDVPCSASEIEQTVYNLLQNAAQAFKQGTAAVRPSITLRIRREGDSAVMEVEDNGPGMDEEVRRKAFEPLFTTKETGQGTGLGLAIAYFIVTKNHRGNISVASFPGKGALFAVTLPLGLE